MQLIPVVPGQRGKNCSTTQGTDYLFKGTVQQFEWWKNTRVRKFRCTVPLIIQAQFSDNYRQSCKNAKHICKVHLKYTHSSCTIEYFKTHSCGSLTKQQHKLMLKFAYAYAYANAFIGWNNVIFLSWISLSTCSILISLGVWYWGNIQSPHQTVHQHG